jgi:hypothetical protein
MARAPSYRFVASITVASVTSKVTGEFAAPDRIHETIATTTATTPAVVVETVFSAGRVFIRDGASGVWRPAQTPTGASTNDPRVAFSVIQRAQNATDNGSAVSFTLPADATRELLQVPPNDTVGEARGSATLTTNGVIHLELTVPSAARTVRIVIDYSAIGSGPPVTAPTGV